MPTYACHDGSSFLLTVDAPTKEAAEAITGMTAVEPVDKKPWAGWIIEDGVFKSPRPFPSWAWDGEKWNAPIEKPNDPNTPYYWDEALQIWNISEQEKPYPSWVIDEHNGNWVAPKPKPQLIYPMENSSGGTYYVKKDKEFVWNETIQDWELAK